jgi:uncharacterized membrane protein YkvI
MVPVEFLLGKLDLPAFRLAFLLVMAVTLMGTCSALIHAVNERVAQSFAEAAKGKFPPWGRTGIAVALMVFSVLVADKVGLVALVDKGYKFLAWMYIFMFMIPILTYGVWKILRRDTPNIALAHE